MAETSKILDERRADRARLRKSLNVFQKTIAEQETLLESDRKLIGRKLKTHLENLERLYLILGMLKNQLESVEAEIQLLTSAK